MASYFKTSQRIARRLIRVSLTLGSALWFIIWLLARDAFYSVSDPPFQVPLYSIIELLTTAGA